MSRCAVWLLSVLLAGGLSGCRGCASPTREAILMLPADCGQDTLRVHGEYYDDPVFQWELQCGDLPDQAGTLRIGALQISSRLACREAEGPACTPCLPERASCGRQEEGLASGYLRVSGDAPLAVGYRLLCRQPSPAPEVVFFLEQDGADITCVSDAYGTTTCDKPGCGLRLSRAP